MRAKLLAMLQKDDEITIYIVASASYVPTTKYHSNFELARKRAEDPEKRIKKILKENKIEENRVYFDKRFIVQGKEYKGDSKNPESKKIYKKSQYVKIWLFSCNKAVKN